MTRARDGTKLDTIQTGIMDANEAGGAAEGHGISEEQNVSIR